MRHYIWGHLINISWIQMDLCVIHSNYSGHYTKSYYFSVLYISTVCLSETSESHVLYTKRKLKKFSRTSIFTFPCMHFGSWCFFGPNIENRRMRKKCLTLSKNDPYTYEGERSQMLLLEKLINVALTITRM